MEDKKIETVKQLPEPQLVRDIQIFLKFANFYRRCIQGFSRIAAPLTLMLKTLSIESAKYRKGVVGVGGGSRKEHRDRADPVSRHEVNGNEIGGNEFGGDEVDDKVGKNQKTSKSKKSFKSKKTIGSSDFFTLGANLAFTKLRQAFPKAPILYHFNPERHIRIKMDGSEYAIGGVLSQLILDDLGQ